MSRLMTAAPAARKEAGRFAKFLVVGAIGFVVDATVFNLLVHVINLPVIIAQAFSFCAALISNFTLNRYWTYPDSRSKRIRHQLLQFALINVIGLGIRTGVIVLINQPYHLLVANQPFVTLSTDGVEFFAGNMILATAVLVVLLWNFFVNRYWTYNDVS
ncbi:MAG: GtrA family protein [Anaerolineales bacterium]|nr:GtrA family protein [Anaerolineales bacterium]